MMKKIILPCCFVAGMSLAQTYDLPILFVDTKGECLDNTKNEKMPATMRVLEDKTNNVADSGSRSQRNSVSPVQLYPSISKESGEGTVSLIRVPIGMISIR